MNIINSSAFIMSTNSSEPLKFIELCGRTAYKSLCKKDSASGFVKGLIKRGHESVLEHLIITVKITTSRGIMLELQRHRHTSLTIQSTRYVDMKEGINVIKPEWYGTMGGYTEKVWADAISDAEKSYSVLRELGLKKEDARGVLPNDLATEIVMTTNAREWRHIFALRTAKDAHPDVQKIIGEVMNLCIDYCKEVFECY